MKSLFAAFRFLTVIPLPAALGDTEADLEKSVYFFPVVGLALGAILSALDAALLAILPVLPASGALVLVLAALTGGLHLDGLGDTADGFMSARPRERVLEIMKDSRTGPMGVTAISFALIMKTALLASVTGPYRPAMIVLMPVAGRSAMVMLMGVLPYIRPEGGMGGLFMPRRSLVRSLWGFVFILAAGWALAGWPGVAAGLASATGAALAACRVHQRIGGVTGDTLGAVCEIVEPIPLLVTAIFIQRGLIA